MRAIIAVWLAAGAAIAGLILRNKAGGWTVLWPGSPDADFRLIALATFVLALAVLSLGVGRAAFRRAPSRAEFWRPLGFGVSLVALALSIAEVILRTLAAPAPFGERIGSLELLPYHWSNVQANATAWRRRVESPTALFDVPDTELGWDLARGRASADGRYAVNDAGVRSRTASAPLTEGGVRVALLGDSYTFAQEVDFAESWGEQLAQRLGGDARVLNFGVPAHGMDQTLLKFRRDVRPLQPQVVVLGVLLASPQRLTAVYLPLRPELELPFAKPRFALGANGLALLNSPPLSAAAILARDTPEALPFIAQDSAFEARHWAEPPLGRLYVARWIASRFPRWTPRRLRFPDAAIAELASVLTLRFDEEVRAAGGQLVVVFLPVPSDLAGVATPYVGPMQAALDAASLPVVDGRTCLGALPAGTAFVTTRDAQLGQADPGPPHYSPAGNAALADCLVAPVRDLLVTPR
jgi:hypothetical protein